MKAVVCLPTRNEAESIQEMIDSIKRLGYDLFIADSNSTDGTQEIARKNKVEVYQRDGVGKGYGIRKAVEVASSKGYDVLVLLDCDKTYPPEEIPGMLEFFPEYDVVLGVRDMKEISFTHRLANIFHTQMINLFYGGHLHDINTGMRAFKVEKYKGLLTAKGFDIEAQMSLLALKKKMKIKEIPVRYLKRAGESKIRVSDGFLIAWRIIRDRF
ncbi:MAG TPA: glycosyltransferase family 2 protein [Candidatus Nanoarchaeia archaeon]|nr:glycosyltransferase family 2 protein [Candidatus Nanoarchaeia archaeon]